MEIIEGKDLINMKFIKTEDGLLKEYKPQSKFIPEKREHYWYICTEGIKTESENVNSYDDYVIAHQLVFRTEEELNDYMWFQKMLDKYKTNFTNEEWKNSAIFKYYLYYDWSEEKVFSASIQHYQEHSYSFTEENIGDFMKIVGEKRIKKYLFNVWE